MSQASSVGAVVVDANVLLGICTKEPKEQTAETALTDYSTRNWQFYAPGVISGEFLFVACQKLQSGLLTQAEYDNAVESFRKYLAVTLPPPSGEAALLKR